MGTCLALTRAISKTHTVEGIYEAALDALRSGLGIERASILLFDPDGVMRFKASRGISAKYRLAVEGHTPWQPDSPDPQPIITADVKRDAALEPYWPTLEAEGIAGLAFIPLVSLDRVIGKFMLYYETPTEPSDADLEIAGVVASQVAFAVERTRAEERARRDEERLMFALDAAEMGTWDWDLKTNTVQWSDNLARIHGLPPGSFDGTFASYEREIHPEDRERVLASVSRALTEGVPHDVEYRLVAPDGTVRWCEGKGRVEWRDGQPVRMSGVCVMATRRKEAELAKFAAVEETGRQKDEFLATLSHELRTPLNAILGWVQMLQQGELSAGRVRQAIEVIARNTRLQVQLIEDILDVSRIIRGSLQIERTPVAVAQLIDAVVSGVAPAAADRRITLERRVEADLPPIEGDPKRLHQVLSNVLTNALKFTPEGGMITLSCRISGDWLQIEVRDTGVGIPADFMPFVFDRFRQADSRTTRRHGGLGLGLAIARHLVDQHGGEIRATSDGPGMGTTVSIRLPTALPTAVAPINRLPDPPDNIRLEDVRVLVVDDQPDSREMLATLLEERGADVRQCDGAQAAFDLMATHPIDVLIADIAMPNVDGYELIRRIRARGDKGPAIAVTAFARLDDRQNALAAGFTDYCSKPIDASLLARTVRTLVPAAQRPRS